jgi:acetate kinase
VSVSPTNGQPILALNCGSSSLKFGLFQVRDSQASVVCEGEAEEIGKDSSSFSFKTSEQSSKSKEQVVLCDHRAGLARALKALERCGAPKLAAVGHRFVHGGPGLREHQVVTSEVLGRLRSAVDYAPLHVPAALSVLEAVQREQPEALQVICLDTAFHRTMADVARTFPLPAEVRNQGVERYGFHGISLESIVAQLRRVPERLVVAHLGNGASITAIRHGESVDTSMGLTPTGGIIMGTRCGDLDPGVVVYLLRHGYATAEALEELFDHRSGLLGVSGKSSDVRDLLSAQSTDKEVDLALRMFCYQARKRIAEMAAVLGGLDTLVFTGGIGEHATELRNEICSGLKFLGGFETLVLPAQEDIQIALTTAKLALQTH